MSYQILNVFGEENFHCQPDSVAFTKSKRVNIPQTSREAHESVKEDKAAMYDRIVKALTEMKVGGTSEEIATYMGVKHDRVWKRCSELVDAGTLYNVGVTRKNSSGRSAMLRQLTELK